MRFEGTAAPQSGVQDEEPDSRHDVRPGYDDSRTGTDTTSVGAFRSIRAWTGRICSDGSWNDSPTTPGPRKVPGRVVVTHPFHPRFGQQLEPIQRRRNWHEDRLFFRVDKDHTESIPLSWTSLAPADPFRECSAGRAWFRATDLDNLAALVEALTRHSDGEDDEA